MTQKNRITYRFDRHGQTVNKEIDSFNDLQEASEQKINPPSSTAHPNSKPAKINVIPLYPSTDQHAISEVSPWNSPFQEDIVALEQLIRNTDSTPSNSPLSAPKPVAAPSLPKKAIKQDKPRQPVMQESFSQEVVPPKEKIIIASQKLKSVRSEAKEGAASAGGNDIPVHEDYPPVQSYEEEFLYDEPKRSKAQYSRIKRIGGTPSWFNVFLSVTAALATGALFGYLLLSLFTGASIWPGGSGENPDSLPVNGGIVTGNKDDGSNTEAGKGTEQTGTEADNPPAAKPNSNAAMVSLKGLDQTYFMLQFGVFSNTEGRDAALAQLAEKGLAGAALTSAADYRVYAGLAGNQSKAKAIRALLPDLDLYIKEIKIATPTHFPFNGEQSVAQSFFDQTALLVQMLDELTLAQLEQPSLTALSESAAASWKTEHQKWTENAATVRIGIVDAAGKAYLDKINQAVNKAAKAMTEYNFKPSHTHLWSAQMGVMEAILTQKEWFETISAL
ncbi:SPOR domain-containing protein [Paenibacillus luteus]|uniref:SPOR domain-containing protein n=1 Tax=Paenibacillus luteus TaxID=2545753 RepID=UPI00114505D6|nr:SPOR domain-containing protein [Paenibacillus luteus]